MTTRNHIDAVAKLHVPFVVSSLVLSLAFISASAGAATISLNYRSTDVSNGGPSSNFILGATDVAGVVAVDDWNDGQHSNLNPSFTVTDLNDDSGSGTTADVTVSSSTGSAGPGQGVSGASSNNKSVLLSPKAIGTNGGPPASPFTMTLSGAEIPYALYDVVVYLNDQRSNSENTSVEATLGGTTYYMQTPDNDESFFDTFGYVQSTDTIDAGDFNNTVANYVRFDGVSGANFSIDFAATQGNTTFDSSRLGIGGVQITEASEAPPAVPEPNTFALGVLALMGLALLRRPRRRR